MTPTIALRPALSALVGAWLVAALAPAASAQDLTRRPGPQDAPVAIVNATIHPVSGPTIPSGFILFDEGVISDIGPMGAGRAFIGTVRQIDAKGKHVYPGLISPHTQVGLTEMSASRPSHDFNEVGDATPEVLAVIAVNPDSTFIPVTRANGVLFCGVFPTGGLIPGRASVIRLEGWTGEDMTVQKDAGLILEWPFMRPITAWWMDRSEDDQRKDIQKNVERIRETFRTARAYLAQKDGPESGATPTDLRWEAMRGVLDKPAPPIGAARPPQTPIFISANDFDQITASVAWAIEEGLRPVILGGRDAALCADLLKKHDVPVIISSTLSMPKRDDSPADESFTLPSRLEAAGVRWCLASGEEPPHERNLPYAAALAAAHGLDQNAALRGITLETAKILGVADRVGSLEKGKEATLFVADGDILEVTSKVETLFVQGKQLAPTSKQSELAEKYREKYKQQKAAPK